jgi:protein SCO1
MDNATKVSNNKIFSLLAFVCVAIMTSVFVFHLSHKNDQPQAASDNSLIFPAGRDIKEFSLVSASEQPFTQQDFRQHWTLLFFGFTHCPNVCPTTLSMLSKAYEQLHTTYPDLRVVLVSLDPERDSTTTLAKYTAQFNPDIIGVSGKIQELHKLQSQLGIYSERSEGDKGNYNLQHTSSILLINPQGKWVGVYKYGMSPSAFVAEFNANMKQLVKA